MTAPATVLRGTTVVDTRDGSTRPARDVVLAGDRIAAIVPTGTRTAMADTAATVVDATGTYLVPGLCDMHAHPLGAGDPSGSLALMLANGITGFRQMAGSAGLLRERAAGELRLPEPSPALLATPGDLLTPVNAATGEAAAATVRRQHADGADFIKVGSVTPEVFFVAQAEARRHGIPIVGHLPAGIDVWAASRGGMRSIEHLGPGVGVLAACSTSEQEILAALAAAPPLDFPADPARFQAFLLAMVVNPALLADATATDVLRRAVDTFSEERTLRLAARFAEDGTWQVPTLIRKRTSELGDDPALRTDPNLRYVSDATLGGWRAAADRFAALPAPVRQAHYDGYALLARVTRLFDEAGVKLLAGSDSCGAGWEVPGFALHQELDLLAEAGLSPLRVLQTATLDAAEFLGTTATMGTVEEGKNADLLLLGGDPTASVAHLHDIRGVVRAGRHLPRTELDAMTERVAAARSI